MSRSLAPGLRIGTVLVLTVLVPTFLVGSASTGTAGARVAAVAAVATGATAATISEWAEGACADASGVTVAVDFQQLGGRTALRCAPGPAADGFDALDRAGIVFRTAVRSPGFLCRIADLPTTDPCITAAPATAYWSYWLAARGGPWCYSNLGAGNRQPPPGTVEGWSFSLSTDGATAPPPRVAPPAPLPGVAPATLGPSDCDSNPPATVPVTSRAAEPAAPIPGPAVQSSLPSGETPDPSEADGVPADAAAPGAIPVGGAATTTAPDTTAVTEGSPGSAPDTSSGSVEAGPAGDTGRGSEEAGSVDLGDDGTSESTSPLGAALAVGLIGALGAGAFVARRRAVHD